MNVIPQIKAQDSAMHEAYFINSFSDFKIYDKGTVDFTYAIKNEESAEESFAVSVFRNNIRIYRVDITCQIGSSIDNMNVTIPEDWTGPNVYEMTVELRTYTGALQDLQSFSVKVVKLFIFDWFYSIGDVVAHSKRNETLLIAFKNGGNDLMYDAMIKVEDSEFFDVEPKLIDVGNISIGDIRSNTMTVRSLNTTEPGNNSLTFQISYEDFEGGTHTEEKYVSILVSKLGTKIILDYPNNIKYHQKIEFSARLSDDDDNSVGNGVISFLLGIEKLGEAKTNSTGITTFEYTPTDLDVGEYEISATYLGSDSLEDSNATGSLIIIPLRTILEMEVSNSALAKENISVTISLMDENGKAIPNRLVMLYFDETNIRNLTTDEKGASKTKHMFHESGDIFVKASYIGEKNYLDSQSDLTTLKVNPMPTRLSLDIESVITKENPVDFKVRLEDKFGSGIENANINLYVNDETFKSSITNKDGTSSLRSQFASSGLLNTLSISAEYDGNIAYAPSSTRRNVTILNLSIFIVLIIVVIAGAALALILFIKFSKGRFSLSTKIPFKTMGDNLCAKCGAKISFSDKFCPFCGSAKGVRLSIDDAIALEEIDEKVFDHLVKHGGTISLEQASKELDIPLERVKDSLGKLKRAGRIAKTNGGG